MLRARGKAPSTGRLLEHESSDVFVEVLLDLIELRDNSITPVIRKRGGEIVEIHRLGGDEENRFECGTEFVWFHSFPKRMRNEG